MQKLITNIKFLYFTIDILFVKQNILWQNPGGKSKIKAN